ncbi:acyclic terpene utilization AtuA family protein [Accumulibacter sp.]|uniref:acyclic terpene utilization AtuA family protein n=1 Tax=Accumulibacter sp. TaxID=2053492 RepID=UPI0026370C68|nr:acyclic terpene utilization AtuA family protein [Accumulibacter sp.]
MKVEFRILAPTAILGYGFPEESLRRGLAERPDLIAVDAGSTDPGPYYLGSGKSFTDRAAVKRDLGYLLPAALARGIPLVIGTAGGSGAAPHLEWCRRIIVELACEQGLSFSMALIRSDVPHATVHAALDQGAIQALDLVPPLTHAAIDASPHIVAQIGVEPFIRALAAGAQVVLAGRAYDPACFAALPIAHGYDAGLALHCGKILECAAIAATPGSGSDCALGILREDSFVLKALADGRRFTAESAAAHTLYEKSDPCFLPGPGGVLDLSACEFAEHADGTVEIRGSRHLERPYQVKLEGARRIGFRTVSIAGVRDPIMIASIDPILAAVRQRVGQLLGDSESARVCFHLYGRNGVMGEREPRRGLAAHELGIVLEVVADTQEHADTVCSLTRSTLLHYGYDGRVATAGNLAFPFSPSDLATGEVYEFSLYHLMAADEAKLFPFHLETVGAGVGQ